jgi:hypothetical protein
VNGAAQQARLTTGCCMSSCSGFQHLKEQRTSSGRMMTKTLTRTSTWLTLMMSNCQRAVKDAHPAAAGLLISQVLFV